MSASRTCLVTGGSGVLGQALTRALLDRGEKVRIFDLRPPEPLPGGAEFVRGDVRGRKAAMAACAGCDGVFHLAACMPQARLGPADFWAVNVGGTLNLLDGCVRHRVRRFVFASTIEIYGPQRRLPLAEDAAKLFTGTYSRNKWECEAHCQSYRRSYGLEVSMIRMPMIFGPGFYHEKTTLTLFERVRKGRIIPIPGRPGIPYSCVAASDAAAAFLLASDREEADGEAFNIAAPDSPTVREFLEGFIRTVGSRSRTVVVPAWLIEPGLRLLYSLDITPPLIRTPPELIPFAFTGGAYSIDKARRLLGYVPELTCAEAVAATYRWYHRKGKTG